MCSGLVSDFDIHGESLSERSNAECHCMRLCEQKALFMGATHDGEMSSLEGMLELLGNPTAA